MQILEHEASLDVVRFGKLHSGEAGFRYTLSSSPPNMSLPLDDERSTHMTSGMGIPPESMEGMHSDPNQLQQFRRMTTDELTVQMMRNTSIAESETPEMMGRRFVEMSKRYKEDNEKERSLPPSKAPTLRKEDMITDLDGLRSFIESANKQRDLQLAQTYLGLPLEFSTTPVADLRPSA